MKKLVAIFLLFVYGSTSVGATVHVHYCMNELVGWSFWHNDKKSECGKCGMKEEKGGCCKDEHKIIKFSSDQDHAKVKAFESQQVFEHVFFEHNYVYLFTPADVDITRPQSNDPPAKSDVPIYILNQTFRI